MIFILDFQQYVDQNKKMKILNRWKLTKQNFWIVSNFTIVTTLKIGTCSVYSHLLRLHRSKSGLDIWRVGLLILAYWALKISIRNFRTSPKIVFENVNWTVNSGKIGKAISIAMTPFYIGGYWTIPILPINRDEYKLKWNKPLAMIQAFLIPIAVRT